MGRVGEQTQGEILPAHCGWQAKLQTEAEKWNRMADVIAGILQSTPEET